MNEFESISASQLDRLVDGELSSGDRRAVLLALDRESDGWRRLALAFLESQAMRQSFSSTKAGAATASMSLPQAAHTPITSANLLAAQSVVSSNRPAHWRSWGPLALCGLLVFGLGRLSLPGASVPVSAVSSVDSSTQTYSQPAEGPSTKHSADPLLVANAADSAFQQQTLRLELGDDSGGPSQLVDVPVVEAGRIAPEDLLQAPSVIPDNVQRALLRSGRRVYEQRQVYEVTLEDGRRGIVPVSEVLVENAGWDVYQ